MRKIKRVDPGKNKPVFLPYSILFDKITHSYTI